MKKTLKILVAIVVMLTLLSGNIFVLAKATMESAAEQKSQTNTIKNDSINNENTNTHCLRHTFATRCVENNSDIKALSEILGHSSVKITLEKYVHPSFDGKINMINHLSPLITIA